MACRLRMNEKTTSNHATWPLRSPSRVGYVWSCRSGAGCSQVDWHRPGIGSGRNAQVIPEAGMVELPGDGAAMLDRAPTSTCPALPWLPQTRQ